MGAMTRFSVLSFASLILLAVTLPVPAAADENCISCHTSEKQRIRNLSRMAPKKSGLTPGAGGGGSVTPLAPQEKVKVGTEFLDSAHGQAGCTGCKPRT